MTLTNRKIILGVTGGIAAYKSAYLARLLVKAGAEVQVIMTEAGTKFITPLTFESLTGREVAVEMFPAGRYIATHHIVFAEWPDLIVVAPATADFIAQVAHGHCASLLATVLCATHRKVVLAPAMNEGMWANPIVQKNVAALKEHEYIFAGVGVGEMACRSYGAGRMAEPQEIFDLIEQTLQSSGPLSGKKVIVTAGPCREAIDPVRFISNRSSGKMGFALAREAERLGAAVTLISGPVSLPDPDGMQVVRVETTDQMAQAVMAELPQADYLIMAAAPADHRPMTAAAQKMKKGTEAIRLELTPTIDILKQVSTTRDEGRVDVGFSLETENDLENSRKKLIEKRLDYIVVNNALEPGAGFDVDTNRVTILSRNGKTTRLEPAAKDIVAHGIWEHLLRHGA
ncbi:MAG: bifunctional phosphopantothenoylcysteine decarboxylase/phosphopantothenate--cysteine ligase CoaBC [candidate division Zixibacteria bacterium]|nr:bifunctional phosphopantothenoylcysteine decarboxylase/phosphopantothenate--cysteine ligase CoaBC [candidate division Zixibacteria bacterium]